MPLEDRYIICDEIGKGGDAVVYDAVRRADGGECVVKVPHASLRGDKLERYRVGVQMAAMVQMYGGEGAKHFPGLIEIEGQDEVVMEKLGKDLKRLIIEAGEGGLSPVKTIKIASGVAEALKVLHDMGLVFCDVKDSNVFVAEDGSVKLNDFGLCMPKEKFIALTSVVGTAQYIAPEAWAFGRGNNDHRVDLYAVGILIIRMLTGRYPFMGSDPSVIMMGHLNFSPRPLPESVPAGLRAIVAKLLEKDPDMRYQNADELIEALNEVKCSL